MCGIIGVVVLNNKCIDIGSTLIEGIKRLDYRGYDSWGLALYRSQDLDILQKEVGICNFFDYGYGVHQIGIAHTRWATNGEVSRKNAHPHIGRYCGVVHNGIIENAESLRLAGSYRDMTDTEILLRWIEDATNSEQYVSVAQAVYNEIEGSNSMIIELSGDIYIVCKGKELYIGKTKEAYIITSEVQTLSGWCDSCIIIKNICVKVCSNPYDNAWMTHYERIAVPSGVFDKKTTMIEEIYQQSNIIKRTTVEQFHRLNPTSKVIVGCGSSYNAALFGRMCFNDAGVNAKAEYSSEYKYWKNNEAINDLIVISQSGETKDTLDIIDNICIAIVNNENSKMARENHLIPMGAGPEFAVAATKTFTMSCFRLLEMAINCRLFSTRTKFGSYIYSGDFNILIEDMLAYSLRIEEFVYATDFDRCIFLGSKYNYPMAREGALKMKEVAYVPSDAMPASEVKHGPIALVDKKCLCVFLDGMSDTQLLSNHNEIKSRGGKTLFISSTDNNLSDMSIVNRAYEQPAFKNLSHANAQLFAILNNILLQLLAYHTAIKKGLNPDRPRGLAKTVTV